MCVFNVYLCMCVSVFVCLFDCLFVFMFVCVCVCVCVCLCIMYRFPLATHRTTFVTLFLRAIINRVTLSRCLVQNSLIRGQNVIPLSEGNKHKMRIYNIQEGSKNGKRVSAKT